MAINGRWINKIDEVFQTSPRIESKSPLWLERKTASKNLARAFAGKGAQVCLDGPTGVGKTSLVLTYLVQEQIKYFGVQITSEMDWQGFCRQVISRPTDESVALTGDLEFGIEQALPTLKARISISEKDGISENANLIEILSRTWTEHDVARTLCEVYWPLFVDDLERADKSLLARLSDLCKLLTQSYTADKAKILFVGSGDIFQRIITHNPALDERMVELSLGTFKGDGSWKFISKGLDLLGIRYPKISHDPGHRKKHDLITPRVFEAANGLPKSLNRLGRDIAINAEESRYVTAQQIIAAANSMTQDHWLRYAPGFNNILQYLTSNQVAIQLVRCLYQDGIGRIHLVPNVLEKLRHRNLPDGHKIDKHEVLSAIDVLVNMNFLFRTGSSSEILFVRNPAAAHTLGVAMGDPKRFLHGIHSDLPNDEVTDAFPKERKSHDAEPE